MPLLDDRGRLFGKVNLIDLAVVLVVIGLLPVAYASWNLFKTPLAVIDAIAPTALQPNVPKQQIQLTGKNLRPFLRTYVQVPQGSAPTTFLFASPESAVVELPALKPGSFDLVLYDETREIGRLPKILNVVAAPTPQVTSVSPAILEYRPLPQHLTLKGTGFAPGLKATVGGIAAGYQAVSGEQVELTTLPLPTGTFDVVLLDGAQEVVRVSHAVTVPKPTIELIAPRVVEASRDPQRIEFKGRHFLPTIRLYVGWREVAPTFVSLEQGEFQLPPFAPGTYDLTLFDPAGNVELARVKNAITVQPPQFAEVTLQARFIVRPEVMMAVKQAQTASAAAPVPGGPAVLASYQVVKDLSPGTWNEVKEGAQQIVTGVVRLLATRRSDGLFFEGQALKAGAPFTLRTSTFQLNGEILGIDIPAARK